MNERIETLQGLMVSDPSDPDLPFLLAKALLDDSDPASAIPMFEKAAEMNPRLAAIWKFWGKALEADGKTQEAINIWTDGIELAQETGDLQAGKEMQVFVKRALARLQSTES